jgi:hypothetical protein
MPCSRKRFTGAELVYVRSGISKYAVWVSEPRDHKAEALIAAELQHLANQNVIRNKEIAANKKALLRREKKRRRREALARGIAAVTPSQPPAPSQTMSPAPSLSGHESESEAELDEEMDEDSDEGMDESSDKDLDSEQESDSETEVEILSDSEQRSQPRSPRPKSEELGLALRTPRSMRAVAVQARESEISMLKQKLGQAEKEKEMLWKLVDVVMEQKAILRGSVESLQWKVARGIQGHQDENAATIATLAGREKELIRGLGVPLKGGGERALITLGGA